MGRPISVLEVTGGGETGAGTSGWGHDDANA